MLLIQQPAFPGGARRLEVAGPHQRQEVCSKPQGHSAAVWHPGMCGRGWWPPTVCDGDCCQATGLSLGPGLQGQPPTLACYFWNVGDCHFLLDFSS